ncbi:MAG: TonB-dependent receptor [Pseudomonadota bacterium]
MKKYKLLGSSCVVLALANPTIAAAQPQPDDEIIVTGEKRGKSVQETATSAEIVTRTDIEQLNVVDLEDALRRIGNAGFATVGSGRNDQFVLRGVSSQGVTQGGSTPVSTLIVDGAFIPNQAAGASIANGWDVTQIEVLRGAQSTIQGRNSLIGSIIVSTQDPTYEWDLRGRATYATADTFETSIAVGGPIIDDELAFRIAAQRLESDGFVTREDGSLGDEETSTLIRGKLLVEPASLPGLRWDLTATYTDELDGSVLVDGTDPEERLQTFNTPTTTEREILILGSELSYDLSDNITLTSVSSFANLKTDEVSDFDGLPAGSSIVEEIRFDDRDSTDWLQEVRLLYDNNDDLSVLFGALYARRFRDDLNQVQLSLPAGVPAFPLSSPLDRSLETAFLTATSAATGGVASIGIPAGVPNLLNDPLIFGPDAAVAADFNFAPEFTTFAVFGEAAYDITDDFNFTFGFRYEREDGTVNITQITNLVDEPDQQAITPQGQPGLAPVVEQAVSAGLLGTGLVTPAEAANAARVATPNILPAFADAAVGPLLALNGGDANVFVPVSQQGDFVTNVFLPKFVLTYDVADNVSVAASAQRAYRPGGAGLNPVSATVFTFDPEFSWNYELAFRSVTMDGRLLFNANAFYIDWSDQQVQVTLSGTNQDEEVRNVGSSRLFGIEVDVGYDITDNLQFFGSVGILDTEITGLDEVDTQSDVANLLGGSFPFAPRYSGSAGFNYDHPSGFNGTVDVNFEGESEPILPNNSGPNPIAGSTGLRNDSRALLNARIGKRFDQFEFFIFGSNLLDEVYLANADALAGRVIVGEPRIVGFGLTFDY